MFEKVKVRLVLISWVITSISVFIILIGEIHPSSKAM